MQNELLIKLKALGEPSRLRIVTLLLAGELTVSEIMQVLGQSQPRISRHLKVLADAGLCERFPEGGFVFYRISRSRVGERLGALLEETASGNDPAIARDLARLGEIKRLRAANAAAYVETAARQSETLRGLQFPEERVEAEMLALAAGRSFSRHLDVGTGTGRMLELFAPQAADGMGVDLSREMLSVARSKMSEAGLKTRYVRQADASALPLENGAADLITIHQVLHYLPEPGRALAECARVLAPGGLMIIVDFAEHGFTALRAENHHRHLGFSRQALKDWLGDAGLDACEMRALAPENPEGGLTVLVCGSTKPDP